MPEANIAIVGGGPAGLSIAGALKHRGLEAVILDKHERVGASWMRRYERLHLHTVRAFSGLPHYPIPRHHPRYLHKDAFAAYLRDYAEHFDLNIVLNCPVHKVGIENNGPVPTWVVESERGTWRCATVVIATGHFGAPRLPDWPGVEMFEGHVLHSSDYRTGRDSAGSRVLIVGSGNSGSEIATDLAEQGAAFVANSVRTPPPIVPRDLLGTPVQLFGILLMPLPPKLADWLGLLLGRVVMGDLTRYGILSPGWGPFTAHRVPIIDVGYVSELKRRRIHIRPNVVRLTRTGVLYQDGREETFDLVIAATGFESGLTELLDVPGVVDEIGYPRYPSGRPTAYRGLYFMGYTESVRGHLFEANRDARRLAKMLEDYLESAT